MNLPELCIRRPVFATVLSLLVLLLGIVSYDRLPVREYPKIEEPVVTVETKYLGASAEIVESAVTKIMEDSIAGIEGVDVLTSISRAETSQITARFRLDRDPDGAAADVRDRVSRVRSRLPQGIDEPVVAKVDADANPVIWLSFYSDTLPALQVSDVVSRIVKPRLQTLPGAADVRIFGERRFAMRIWLDADRLAAYKLTPSDVEDALRRQNIEVPAGRIESLQREFTVTSQTDLQREQQFLDIVVKVVNGYPVSLGDVARVKLGALNERTNVTLNGQPAVSVGLIKQATANPLVLAAALKTELPKLQQSLPQGLNVRIANDTTVFIDKSLEAVFRTILEAVALVALVILIFLGTLRASVIPLVTIPVCLIGACTLMYAAGFSINTLTLLALVLAIGLVVDDAIVVLENIFRHIEAGMKPFEAAILGTREVQFAVIAMTLTLAAVFTPIAFTTGRTGRLFVEFALSLAGAVLISGFVALTLTPMMCSRLLRSHADDARENRLSSYVVNGIDRIVGAITNSYAAMLRWALRWRWLVLILGLSVGGASAWLFMNAKKELTPLEDRGTVVIIFSAPEGSSVEYTMRYGRLIGDIAEKIPEFDRRFVVSGSPTVTQGIGFLRMVDWDQRQRGTADILKELQPKLLSIPGVLAFAVAPPSLGQSPRVRPINFVVLTSEPYDKLQATVAPFLAEMQRHPGLQGVDVDLKLNKPEIKIEIDRQRAADAGVQVEAIGRALETMLGGRQVTRFKREGEQYDVMVQLDASARATPRDIADIYVRGRGDTMVPLASLVSVRESVAPRELNHFAQRRAVTITANLAPGYSLGEAITMMEASAQKYLKPGYAIDYNGETREFKLSSTALYLTFLLALAFIYLVLAAQFESFIDPLIIMFSVPLSMTGALALLKYGGGSINVYSQIGLITLVGLITKHGILIVEFANQLQREGRTPMEAVFESAKLRLRPILMTTGAMVLGAVPLALSTGAGAESRIQIGLVIVGGMSFGTILTLFVVPVVYSLIARRRQAMQALGGAHAAGGA
ncbi:MAG: efflux RND transporter permease subunit [Betaproteobacteria bacterium]|nr:efflux RND transporter permease subunit [Pseudomonadota bacterium]NBP34611.1 efflux RND transporter permease subunit [Betaproteobacteria bacterium]NBQ94451.1 efflux RND transporter permease subunit [Betaproteobacteria bacterium]NBS38884.1 efflux RND transporter permease subunit [Betaproteobacteria bacterium]NBT70941.1 efflux RND transporter permease subunit [Betaproteobacteria bacterium]